MVSGQGQMGPMVYNFRLPDSSSHRRVASIASGSKALHVLYMNASHSLINLSSNQPKSSMLDVNLLCAILKDDIEAC